MSRHLLVRPSIALLAAMVVPVLPAQTGLITTVAGNGTAGAGGIGGPAVQAQISAPGGIALDSVANVYIADMANNRVVRVDAASGVLTVVAGDGTQSSGGDGFPAAMASLNGPIGLVFDAAGNLFISEFNGNRVRRIDAQTSIITTVAGNGMPDWSGDGGPAAFASLSGPAGLAIDRSGNLYIADSNNGRVRRVDGQNGTIATVAGNGANNGFVKRGARRNSRPLRLALLSTVGELRWFRKSAH
jgi:sugar lactone lactonase YvrE